MNIEKVVHDLNVHFKKPKTKGKLRSNIEKIEQIINEEGRDWCLTGELPYPKAATKLINKGPVLAVVGCRVYFKSINWE